MAARAGKLTAYGINSYLFRSKYGMFCVQKRYSVTGNPQADKALTTLTGGRIEGWLKSYEDLVGLTEVRDAQNKVIEAETKFLTVQDARRSKQLSMGHIQSKLKEIHAQLDKVQRGDERYLALLTEEYEILKQEKQILTDLENFETQERQEFALLSSGVRESHERERQRTERTKYWSIIGSIIGATIGIFGTSVNNYLRMRELRGIVNDSASEGAELKGLVGSLSESMRVQHSQIQAFIRDLKGLALGGSEKSTTEVIKPHPAIRTDVSDEEVQAQSEEILKIIKHQDEVIKKDMSELKKLIGSSRASDIDGNIIYVGPEIENILQRTENNIEWKIKTNGLWTVTVIYGAFALTLPILYAIFKNN